MKKTLFIISMLISIPAWSNDYCRSVFNKLVGSVSTMYGTKPRLTIVESDYLIADTYSTGEIKVGSRLIELCRKFGPDSSNAVAHILSHELAHYYQNHAWLSNFTSSYASVEWSRNLSKKEQELLPVYETQADEMGFFYALNAGFQTWKIAPALLDSIYTWYGFEDSIPGYPPLMQRKKIATTAVDKVRELTPVFNISNYFMLLGRYHPGETQLVYYQSAGLCLDHIIHENIKTPNVLNNRGALYFLEAQKHFSDPLNQLIYPLIIDNDFCAVDVSDGSKGSPTISEDGRQLLMSAKDFFFMALKHNTDYLPANINLTLVHFILNEPGAMSDKLKLIRDQIKDDKSYKPVYHQLMAFNYFIDGNKGKMNQEFKKAMKSDPVGAVWNHNKLNKASSSDDDATKIAKWPMDTTEKIFGQRVYKYFKSYRPSMNNVLRPYHQQYVMGIEPVDDGTIYVLESQFVQTIYFRMYFYEIENKEFITSKGLKLGDHKEQLVKLYNEPYSTSLNAGTTQYLYPSQSLIVTFNNHTERVTNIMYYGTKK